MTESTQQNRVKPPALPGAPLIAGSRPTPHRVEYRHANERANRNLHSNSPKIATKNSEPTVAGRAKIIFGIRITLWSKE